MKRTVQIMGMGFRSVFILTITYSALFFFHVEHALKGEQGVICSKCHYSSKYSQNWQLARRFIFHLIKKEKERLHINNLQFEQPYSSILIQILLL